MHIEGAQHQYKGNVKRAIIELCNFSFLMRSMYAFIDQKKEHCVMTKSEANMRSSLDKTCIDECNKGYVVLILNHII